MNPNQSISIGKALSIPNRVILAPLAGVTDVPFRRICQEMGAGLSYVEMLSAVAVIRQGRRTHDMLARHSSEGTLGVQLTGPSPEECAAAARLLEQEGFETIDLNMGCPVRKIVRKGGGSAMLREPERVEATLTACRDAVQVPVTAKIRLGYTRAEVNVDDICERLARAGAAMITIHGRTRQDDYSNPVDLPGIAQGIRMIRSINPSIPTVGNGDIFDPASAQAMFQGTGCDAVMVSRGCLGNPWIFAQLLGRQGEQPTRAEWTEILLRHIDYHAEHFGDDKWSAIKFRKHLLWYVKGFNASRRLRGQLSTVNSLDEVRRRIRAYSETLDPDLRRFATHLGEGRLVGAGHDPKFDMDREADRGVGLEIPKDPNT